MHVIEYNFTHRYLHIIVDFKAEYDFQYKWDRQDFVGLTLDEIDKRYLGRFKNMMITRANEWLTHHYDGLYLQNPVF